MNNVGANKPIWLWQQIWKKDVMEKTTKFFEKTCPPPIERVLCKHFLSSFKANGEDHKRRRRLLSFEGVFLWSCYTFPPQVTLSSDCFPHPTESLGFWRGSRFVCQPSQMAVSQELGPLCFVWHSRSVQKHLEFKRLLRLYTVSLLY